jgi:hypothetical protein
MLKAGVAIVTDYPLLGVGPDQIERVYPHYRVPEAVKPTNQHLHNVTSSSIASPPGASPSSAMSCSIAS